MQTPSDWDGPVFLMNFPLSVSNGVPNNVLMNPTVQGKYNTRRAGEQWLKLYKALAEKSLVYVLPGHGNFQDLPFVANLGCYLPHLENTVLLSNFTSPPRKGEDVIGRRFFEAFGYRIEQPPHCWEGEADLKWVTDNLYVGGIGSRSTPAAFAWMQDRLDMRVIEISIMDPKLYHLDCVFFSLTEVKALVNVSAIKASDIKKLEKIVEIIAVPENQVYAGWTNSVRLGDTVFHAPTGKWLPFAKLLAKHGFGLEVLDLTEFDKSGADLSCLCMHLNYKNRFNG